MKETNNKVSDSLLPFWNDKIRKKNFSDVQNINSIVNEIDNIIKVLDAKNNKRGNTTITVKEEIYNVYEPSKNIDLRTSLPLHILKKKIYDNMSETEETETIITITKETYKVSNDSNELNPMEEGKEGEGEGELQNNKKHSLYNNIRINSSYNLPIYEFEVKTNEDGDNDNMNEQNVLRFSRKAGTVGGKLNNNLHMPNFDHQEEVENVNFIIKKKKFTNFISFIDIDLFLQYLALDKNFFESRADDKLLVEGFCLQYQTFILTRTIICKIISCFEYYYSDSEIIEEKAENEEDKDLDEDNLEQRRKNTCSKRKLSDLSANTKIPFGIIDFLCTFITIHNIYCHHELSYDLINKIFDFLKRLKSISEVKEKYADKLEIAEIELKEYEVTVKRKVKNNDVNEFEEEQKEKGGKIEEKIDNSQLMLPKAGTFNNTSFKLNIAEPRNQNNFLNIYSDQKAYEFDITKYKLEDIAFELTRVNYSMYSRVKVKEFLKGVYNGKDKYKLSPNICRIIKRFNSLSAWVIEEILAYDHAEKRSQILLTFIKICVILEKIGNFDDCLSIMTAITNSNINKLQKTWGHIRSVDQKQYLELKKLLSFEDNWRNLRTKVEKQIQEKKFFIPYLGYYTKRITSLEESPYVQKNTSLINIEKILEIYKVLKEFYTLRQVKNKYHCADENIRKELYLLQCLEPSNEDILSQTANLLEPKFVLSNKKMNEKRRTKTDMNFYNNINKNKNDII